METKNIDLKKTKRAGAFTLIELLVVIAIISIIAALVIGLVARATTARRIKRVQVELAKLQTVIEAYEAKLGFFPPDNGNLVNENATRPSAKTNQLFYELAGASYNEGSAEYTSAKGTIISKKDVQDYFKRDGIVNSLSAKSFYSPKEAEHKSIVGNIQVLIVPVELEPGQINPWRYDASSTNRHNIDSYDLWAEILVSGKTKIIGNWKE